MSHVCHLHAAGAALIAAVQESAKLPRTPGLALSARSVLEVSCDTSAPDSSYQMAAFALASLFRMNPI